MVSEPQQLIEQLEASGSLPAGSEERFNGYGVMGLPFQSGHILALRRFPSSSIGPAYTSVWHRSPDGNWFFFANTHPNQACTRYFGEAVSRAIQTDITLQWLSSFHLKIAMPAMSFEWEITALATAGTRFMNIAGRLLPNTAWHNPALLTVMSIVAGPLLGVGHVSLQGTSPNGQHFIANPRVLWVIVNSHARLAGEDFGPLGAVYPQAHVGDFWIPQRGILAIGQTYFDLFDPKHHSSKTSRLSNE